MENIMNLLNGPMGQMLIQNVSSQLGSDQKSTEQAVDLALPALMTALAKNAQSEEGAKSLYQAVEKDHDGSVLENIAQLAQNPSQGPGAGILKHVLGGQRGQVEQAVSKRSGLNPQATGQLMEVLAPVVMGMLGKQQRQQGLDVGGLVGMLTGMKQQATQQQPKEMSMIESLIDSNNDGNVVDDIAKIGMNLLGGFMKGRK